MWETALSTKDSDSPLSAEYTQKIQTQIRLTVTNTNKQHVPATPDS